MITMTMRRSALAFLTLAVSFSLGSMTLADPARYAVTAKSEPRAEGAPAEFQAENPANQLRLAFPLTGLIGRPELAGANAWSFDFRLAALSFDGRPAPLGDVRLSASGDRVDYDFGTARVSYANEPSGLKQVITIAEPEIRGKAGAPVVIGLDFSVGSALTPIRDGYFVKMLGDNGEAVLRYGPIDATDAEGKRLDAILDLAFDEEGAISGTRVTVNAVDPAYPIEIRAAVASPAAGKTPPGAVAGQAAQDEIVGVPVTVGAGIVETVAKLMEREGLLPQTVWLVPRETHHELDLDEILKPDPNAPPPMSHWPPIPQALSSSAAPGEPNLPQTVGTSFKGVGISESGFIPPDSMGDVGPTQVLFHVNGRVKVFSKTGTLGALNVSESVFWASQSPTGGVSDPQVRYDRLSARWFVLAIDLAATNNKILLAVSSGPTITNQSSFTFYSFNIGTPAPSDAGCFCDYPGMGVDANAIYTGCNMFTCASHQSAFVIRKSSVLSGGPMVVTGFPNIASPSIAGPYSPRGVDNDDPNFAFGYIIGSDPGFLNRMNLRKVTNPGGIPTIGPTITLAISNTNMLNQPALGSTIDVSTLDTRLFAASIHKNKITGVLSLWTAHAVEVDATCTPAASGNSRRIGAKWYELGNLSTTPTITQFGTLCTTAPGSAITNSERGFFFPTVAMSGQGHMALGSSFASAAEFVGVAAAGRLRTDPLAGTRAPETIVLAGLASYTNGDPSRNRWGDYSLTGVDPNDDQTIWTFQEYADTPANNWSVRAVQLKAPPPPTTASAGNVVCLGVAAAPLTLTGADACIAPTCTNGLCTGGGICPEFFDPGPDSGGPGYANRINATVTGGITVNSIAIVPPANPATERVRTLSLSLNTTATTTGTKTVSVINPDGQARTYNAVFTVVGNRVPVANTGAPYSVCLGGSAVLNGTGSSDPDATCGDSIVSYDWDLNGDAVIDATGATPTITPAQLAALGLGVGPHTISLKVTDSRTATNTATGTLTILANASGCSDGNACTQTDTCQAGTCVGANPVTCSALDSCHVAGVCDTGTGACSNPNAPNGTACTDGSACTQADSCQAGVCVGANPVNCVDGNPCTLDSCNPATGACSNPNAANGTTCNDANACTLSDSCQSGVCTGANPVICAASGQCKVAGVCNPATGVCSNPNAPNGATCNDGNACTQTDACQNGTCLGANPVICVPLDQCHIAGVCSVGSGVCSNPNAPNGTVCNDANACTQTDTCQTGTCTGANPVICTPSDQCYVAGVCNTGTGICSNPAASDGTVCNDQNATTCGDVCTSAVCAGQPVPAPAAIDDSLRLDKTPSDATITWADAPGPYGVYRGSNGPVGTPWSYDQTCLAPGVVVPSVADPAIPDPGVFFYYLVTRFDQCRESIPGEDSSQTPIPNALPCPAP